MRTSWVLLFAALALTAMLVAGCGGGGDPRAKVAGPRAKVAAGLRHYFSTFSPEDSVFPTGAGPPRVKDNGCKDLHRTFPSRWPYTGGPGGGALWQCFVRFNNFTLTVHVAVNDSTEVVWAVPVYPDGPKGPTLSPARTYTG